MIERNGGLMDDLISRKAVFELLDDIDSIYLEDYDDTFKSYTDLVNALFDEDRLPSAQPKKRTEERTETHACDLISRKAAMEEISKQQTYKMFEGEDTVYLDANDVGSVLASLPSAQPILYGYPVEHLAMIAMVLQKENFPPERISEMLSDVGRIVDMVRDAFEETLRKAVEQCTMT